MTGADIIARIKKQPIGFTCGLICVLCLAWLFGLRSGALEARQAEYDIAAAKAKEVSSNVSLSKTLPAEVAELQVATKELESRLVRAGQLALNQQYFYRLEAENEVKLLDVRQNTVPRTAKTIYMGVPYNVNVQGPYKNVMAFLQKLEKGRHFCRIHSAAFTKTMISAEGGAGTTNGVTLALSLELLGQP
jgi:Tfp pilus assembly protein PilO